MTLIIDLTPLEEARLREAALVTGLEPAELAKKLVTDNLPAAQSSPYDELDARLRALQAQAGTPVIPGDSTVECRQPAPNAFGGAGANRHWATVGRGLCPAPVARSATMPLMGTGELTTGKRPGDHEGRPYGWNACGLPRTLSGAREQTAIGPP